MQAHPEAALDHRSVFFWLSVGENHTKNQKDDNQKNRLIFKAHPLHPTVDIKSVKTPVKMPVFFMSAKMKPQQIISHFLPPLTLKLHQISDATEHFCCQTFLRNGSVQLCGVNCD